MTDNSRKRVCRDGCRHWVDYIVRVRLGAITRRYECEYRLTPDKDGACPCVWPKSVEEEVQA